MHTGPFSAYVEFWGRAFDFSGRTRRAAFWGALLIDAAVTWLLSLVGGDALVSAYALVSLVPTLSVMTRRLHDTGRTVWWLLIGLVPLLGGIVLLVVFLMDSDGANRWGDSPKYGATPF